MKTNHLKDHVMIDLETLGTKPGCTILSIGAVMFDEDGLGAEFHEIISRSSCHNVGLVEDPQTMEWWAKQTNEARETLQKASSNDGTNIWSALSKFYLFLEHNTESLDQLRVWGNGAAFDEPILTAAHAAVHFEPPWKFYNSRCYRTLKALRPDVKLVRTGTHHNALDDALSQAEHAVRLLDNLKVDGPGPWYKRFFR